MSKKYATDEERREGRLAAQRRYNHSEKGKATQKRRNPEKDYARYARYRQTEGYAAAQERRRVKDQALGWPVQLGARRRLRAVRPEMVNAWLAVRWALELDVIQRPDACVRCGQKRRLHAHHHNGYDRQHWIDVVWLCVPCHKVAHAEMRAAA